MDKSARRILLVEDDLVLAGLYKARFEREGYEVSHCPDGEKALQAAQEFHPELVLLDLMMPKLDGFSVIDILRNTSETAKAKIVVLSAMGQPEDQERAMKLGADDYLVKSQVLIDDILAAIKRNLDA